MVSLNNHKIKVVEKTEEWINAIMGTSAGLINPSTNKKYDSDYITSLFSNDALLIGTLSTIIRNNYQLIKDYFDFFAYLPNLKVLKRTDNIEQIDNNVFVNNSFITWIWDSVDKPVIARMSFIFKKIGNNLYIYMLHSSVLPEKNPNLKIEN